MKVASEGEVLVAERNDDRRLTASEFQFWAEVPPEVEWFRNIQNRNTRRAYKNDVQEFIAFAGIRQPGEFRLVKRTHLIEWRKTLEARELEPATIRRKLSALSSLFDFLCESNAVAGNPADGVKRPSMGSNEGKSPALSGEQGKQLLNAPDEHTLKGLRDRAILSALLYHGLRRAELCGLSVGDIHERQGVQHFRVEGKGGKTRFVPIHTHTIQAIWMYLALAGHVSELKSPLFRPVQNRGTGLLEKPLTGHAVYKDVVRKYAQAIGIQTQSICVHGLRATAATNALDHEADIAKVQEWLGHSSISTTRLYDRRRTKPEDSPTFKVSY